jgi:predicted glycosyltransferase
MVVLFDIVHPAHVHFFKHIIRGLQKVGHKTLIVARDKDVTLALLNHYGFDYVSVGQSGKKTRFSQLTELIHRDWEIWKIARKAKPDVILTRNPAGVQAARLTGALGIFDTDDGRAAGIHFRAAAPFANIITTPDCLEENFGRKHITYPGYKQCAYLHPDLFKPNPAVLKTLRIDPGQKYFLVRFVDMIASHDTGEAGLSYNDKTRIIEHLMRFGRVFVSSEGRLPEKWQSLKIKIPPHMLHDALAYATLHVGDSQTMAAEAAMLATPNLRVSTFSGRIGYLNELEHRYRLTFGFHPNEIEQFFTKLNELLEGSDYLEQVTASHRKLIREKCNVARWFIDFIENLHHQELGDQIRRLKI